MDYPANRVKATLATQTHLPRPRPPTPRRWPLWGALAALAALGAAPSALGAGAGATEAPTHTELGAALGLCRAEAAREGRLPPDTSVRYAIAMRIPESTGVLVDVEFRTATLHRYVCRIVPHRGGFILLDLTHW